MSLLYLRSTFPSSMKVGWNFSHKKELMPTASVAFVIASAATPVRLIIHSFLRLSACFAFESVSCSCSRLFWRLGCGTGESGAAGGNKCGEGEDGASRAGGGGDSEGGGVNGMSCGESGAFGLGASEGGEPR